MCHTIMVSTIVI